jgi:glutathione S-transferase
MNTLVGLPYSPWSEKARWALDHHRIPFKFERYMPMIGEPRLRLRMRKLFGRVSVPVLFHDDAVTGDSLAIARFAERTGKGKTLFQREHEPAITAWNERSEALLRGGRAIVIVRMGQSAEAKSEALPRRVPLALRAALVPVASASIEYLARKYSTSAATTFDHESGMRDALDALRVGLDGGKKRYLEGEFSFADVAMATALQVVLPVADSFIRLGPATREAWTHAELSHTYADLIAWRDEIYAKHRRS